ncbi:hypothetical protein H4219_002968 [Mycoemilia scoparia]|uniref:DUF3533 domain-containing protein n=1 Tax=Mycoemilia scoparia TaxID=417184 RepID=A0A9W7ZWX8_9FUNG|nr:hypothetical protein H4219_002968 [Mycoemilia scoparia]
MFLVKPDGGPKVPIYHSSVKGLRRLIEKNMLKMMLVLTAILWLLLALTNGPIYAQDKYIYRVKVSVVDFDKTQQSGMIKELILSMGYNGTNPQMPTIIDRSDDSDWSSHDKISKGLRSNQAWAAWVIEKGFGESLASALYNGTEYQPQKMGRLYLSDTHPYFALVRVQGTVEQMEVAVESYSRALVLKQLLAQAEGDAKAIARANPAALAKPFAVTVENVAFFSYPISNFVMSIAISMNLVLCFIPSNMWKGVFAPFWKNVKVWQAVGYNFLFSLLWLLYTSMTISLIVLAFHKNSEWDWSAGNFFGLWGILALGNLPDFLWVLIFQSFVTPLWAVPMYVILLFLNIPSTLYGPDLSHQFFRWYYAMPFYNTSVNIRTMFLHSDYVLYRSIVIPFAWTILFVPIATWLMIRRARLMREGKINAMNMKVPQPPSDTPAARQPSPSHDQSA